MLVQIDLQFTTGEALGTFDSQRGLLNDSGWYKIIPKVPIENKK